MDKTAIVYKAH